MINNISVIKMRSNIKFIDYVKYIARNIFRKKFDHTDSPSCFKNSLSNVTLKIQIFVQNHTKVLIPRWFSRRSHHYQGLMGDAEA